MICVDLEQIRDLWKINTDKEPGYTKLVQNRRVAAAEAGVTFQRLIILRDVTKCCTPQVSLCFKVNSMKVGTVNKFWEAHALVSHATGFIYRASKSCFSQVRQRKTE